MKKILLLAAMIFLSINIINAQSLLNDPDYLTYRERQATTKHLYNVEPKQYFATVPQSYNYQFTYLLPNDGKLEIDFLKLHDWGTKNRIQEIAAIAVAQINFIKDSFRSAYSEKLVEMNIPVNNDVVSLNYNENEQYKNQLALKNGKYYHLKTGFDTIRIVKNIGIRPKTSIDSGALIQIQYTFILKDIQDLITLTDSSNILERIGNITDSILSDRRKTWKRPDAPFHFLSINVDGNNNDSTKVEGGKGYGALTYIGTHFAASISLGAIVYNNSVSPYSEITCAYVIPTKGNLQGFVGFNYNAFGYLSYSPNQSNAHVLYQTYNAEFGFFKKGSNFMQQKTSIVLGFMHIQDQETLFNFGGNFGINRYLSIGVNVASNLKGKNSRTITGVNLKFNL